VAIQRGRRVTPSPEVERFLARKREEEEEERKRRELEAQTRAEEARLARTPPPPSAPPGPAPVGEQVPIFTVETPQGRIQLAARTREQAELAASRFRPAVPLPPPTVAAQVEAEIAARPQVARPTPPFRIGVEVTPPEPSLIGGEVVITREQVAQAINTVLPDIFARPSAGISPEDVVDDAVQRLEQFATEDMEGLLDTIKAQGRSPEAEALLRFLGVTPQQAAQFFAPTFEELAAEVFPEFTPEQVVGLAEARPDVFVEAFRTRGRTKAGQDLLRTAGFSWDQVNEIYDTKRVSITIDGTRRTVSMADNGMVLNDQGQEIGRIDPDTQEFVPYEYRFAQDVWKPLTASAGDLAVSAGGASRWLGADGFGERLSEGGQFLQVQGPPDTLGEFTWEHFYNPRWWSTKFARGFGFTLWMVPAMIVGSWAGAAVAGVAGAGRYGTLLLRSLGATGVARPLESALEAGQTYDEAMVKWGDRLRAKQASDEVFWNNMKLAGSDMAQLLVTFAPAPARTFSNMIARGLVKTTTIGGRVVFDAVLEGGEEVLQINWQREALGEPVVWDAEAQESFALGVATGGFLGSGAVVYTSIKDQTIQALSPELRAQFDLAKQEALTQGLKNERAVEAGLDAIAEQQELADITEAVVRQEEINQLEVLGKPKGAVEQLAWEHTLTRMREDAPQVPVPEVTGVAGRIQPQLEGLNRIAEALEDAPGATAAMRTVLEVGRVVITEASQPGLSVAERESLGNRLQEVRGRLMVQSVNALEAGNTELASMLEEAASFVARTGTAVEPLLEELEAPIDHRGTEPEGIAIADELGIRYEGIQVGAPAFRDLPAVPSRMLFTDLTVTDSTFTAESLGDATAKLAAMRETFAKARPSPTAPRPEPGAPTIFSIEEIAPVEPELPDQTIPPQALEEVPHIDDLGKVGIESRVRPTRKTFFQMGLSWSQWKPFFESEVKLGEAKTAFQKGLRQAAKWVGKNKERRALVFRELETPGSQPNLTFNEKRAVTWFRQFFDEWADTLNLPPEKRRTNYVTHIFEAAIEQQKGSVDAAIAGMLEYVTPKTLFNPNLLKRLGATTGLIEDPIKAAEAYGNRQLRIFYYEPMLQKVKLYARHAPPTSARYLNEWALRMTGRPLHIDEEAAVTTSEFADIIAKFPGAGPALARRLKQGNPAGWASYNFTSALYVAWLGFKATSAIRNLSQHTLIISETGPLHFANGIRLRFTEEGKAALTESLVVRSRRSAFVPGIDDSFMEGWADDFREVALFAFRLADAQNVSDAFLAGYSEAKNLLPDADRQVWIDRGDEVAMDTQYLYTKLNSMPISQSAPGRVFAVLTTWSQNWIELMVKWGQANPSKVYTDLEQRTGIKLPKKNWSNTRKSLLLYMLIVGLAFKVADETRLRALEYTGLTSIEYIAGIIGGDFPALELPGAVASLVAGFMLQDERMMKSAWAELDPVDFVGILNQLEDVASGAKDWLTLFFYLDGKGFQVRELKDRWEPTIADYEKQTTPTERSNWRKFNPKKEAQLFVLGRFTTLVSDEARAEVLRLIEVHGLDTEQIKGYHKVFGEIAETAINTLDTFQDAIGSIITPPAEVTRVAKIDYFEMGNYATEVNEVVRQIGIQRVRMDGSPLTRLYLEAKDLWVAYNDNPDPEARKLMRQQFPDLEASLYLFGHIQAFENPQGAVELLKVMDKFDIPPEGIRAFNEDPERYDVLFTPLWQLRLQWDEKLDTYDALGQEFEDDALLEEQRKFLEGDPDFRMARRRIDALNLGATEAIADKVVQYQEKVFEFNAGSAESYLYRFDNPDVNEWGMDPKTMGWKSLEETAEYPLDRQVRVWTIDVDFRTQDEEYAAFTTDAARFDYMEDNKDYRLKSRERQGLKAGVPDEHISTFVDYYEELRKGGFRNERFLANDLDYYEDVYLNPDYWPPDAPHKEVLFMNERFDLVPDEQYDVVRERWPEPLMALSDIEKTVGKIGNLDERNAAREDLQAKVFQANPGLYQDLNRLKAYGEFRPGPLKAAGIEVEDLAALVEDAIGYQAIVDAGVPEGWEKQWKDNRYLRDHQELFLTLQALRNWANQDFTKIPSERFEEFFNTEFNIEVFDAEKGKLVKDAEARKALRGATKWFDDEGVALGFWEPHPFRTPTGRERFRPLARRFAR